MYKYSHCLNKTLHFQNGKFISGDPLIDKCQQVQIMPKKKMDKNADKALP